MNLLDENIIASQRELLRSWKISAVLIGVHEDYDGTWSDEFAAPLQDTLDKMLEESQPRRFEPHEIEPPSGTRGETVVRLLNRAWNEFESDPDGYRAWEDEAKDLFLKQR